MDKGVILVTGGSRGIGEKIVEEYKNNGYEVYAPTREELDLADRNSIEQFLQNNKDTYFSVLINNAGCNDVNYIENITDKELDDMIQVNLAAPFLLIRGIVSKMKEHHFGRIVNISSIWSVVSKSGRTIYSATKHGIHGITITLAIELAKDGILVNTVAPGFTMTELTRKNNSGEEIREMESKIPMGRLAQPEEIAKVVYYLGNERNTYITGQKLVVDGGFTVQ